MLVLIKEFKDDYRFLSNFYLCTITYAGIQFPSVEHAFQAAKTFDFSLRRQIAGLGTPGAAKRMGRTLKLRADWESIKLKVMEGLVMQKFTRHPELKQLLLATEGAILEEGNTWSDLFWGKDLRTGEGQNHLGKLLMKVRKEIGGASES
jgi:ribA/ribD-fused uncharacterized protein